MTEMITRETMLKDRVADVKEGQLVFELLKVAEEFGIRCIDEFSIKAQEYVYEIINKKEMFRIDDIYTYVMNVLYIVELYLRGYYNKEKEMEYEEFLLLIQAGKARKIIDAACDALVLHCNRLRRIIIKAKRKIPAYNPYYEETRKLLKELEKDIGMFERYPNTEMNLSNLSFGNFHSLVGPQKIVNWVGFLTLEETVYSLYNELSILAKFEQRAINSLLQNIEDIDNCNLFEKVINNYLFALPYSEEPETLKISKVDAELLIKEIMMGTLGANELVHQLINRFEFSEYQKKYLEEYGEYIQSRINSLKNERYFGELFIA